MGYVTDAFRYIRIDLAANTYDSVKGAHAFGFFTKIMFDNSVTESQFRTDLIFSQDVRSVSNREAVISEQTVSRVLHRTEWHDDGYSVADFKWSGSESPELSYIMTNDHPGAYGEFLPGQTINWIFEFRQRIFDRRGVGGQPTLQHDTGAIRIQVRGNGTQANFIGTHVVPPDSSACRIY